VFVYSGQGSQWEGMGQKLLGDEKAGRGWPVGRVGHGVVEQDTGESARRVLESASSVGSDGYTRCWSGCSWRTTVVAVLRCEPECGDCGIRWGGWKRTVVAGEMRRTMGETPEGDRHPVEMLSRGCRGRVRWPLLEFAEMPRPAEKLIAGYIRLRWRLVLRVTGLKNGIAGPHEQGREVIGVVDAQGRLARRVAVRCGVTSPTIDPILPSCATALADWADDGPKIPTDSTVGDTNGVATGSSDADYGATNLAQPCPLQHRPWQPPGTKHSTRSIEVAPTPTRAHQRHQRRAGAARAISPPQAAILRWRQRGTATTPKQSRSYPPGHAFGPVAEITKRQCDRKNRGSPDDACACTFEVLGRIIIRCRQVAADSCRCWGCTLKIPSGRGSCVARCRPNEVIPWLADHKVHADNLLCARAKRFLEMDTGRRQ